jgi:methionyl-tRNA formyltransferase
LPRYRGAAPILCAIWEGEQETGISIMRLAEKLDAGDVMLQEKTAIGPHENTGALRERLAELAGKALVVAPIASPRAGTATSRRTSRRRPTRPRSRSRTA